MLSAALANVNVSVGSFASFTASWGLADGTLKSLAQELEVSQRTIHRLMQTLSMAGVPWYVSKEHECYRVRPGFKFPGFVNSGGVLTNIRDREATLASARDLLR